MYEQVYPFCLGENDYMNILVIYKRGRNYERESVTSERVHGNYKK